MRNLSQKIINAQTNATASSAAIDANQLYAASFIGQFTDATAAGTLKIQASNDWDNAGNLQGFVPASGSWVDVPSASVVIVAGATALVPMPVSISYRWLRIVWTRSAGAGNFTVQMNAQGF